MNMPTAPLTPKQKKTLDFVADYMRKNGYAPTAREVQQRFRLKSHNAAVARITGLVRKGALVKAPNIHRGLLLPETVNPKET